MNMKMGERAVPGFFLVLLLLVSCRVSRDFPAEYKGDQIHFGQGGGFTGFVTSFMLLDDGRLFEKTHDSDWSYVSRWERALTRQMFTDYASLGLGSRDLNCPGDKYYFLELYRNSEPLHHLTWGQEGCDPPSGARELYGILYKSVTSK